MNSACAMETVALEDRDFLDSHPDRAEVAIAHIVKQSATAFYIVKTGTPDGREWAVSKRFSAFVDLRKSLCNAALNPTARKVETVPFPPKVRVPNRLCAPRGSLRQNDTASDGHRKCSEARSVPS